MSRTTRRTKQNAAHLKHRYFGFYKDFNFWYLADPTFADREVDRQIKHWRARDPIHIEAKQRAWLHSDNFRTRNARLYKHQDHKRFRQQAHKDCTSFTNEHGSDDPRPNTKNWNGYRWS